MKKKIKFFIISLITLSIMSSAVLRPVEVSAQSGEGADVCVWYSANGFSDRQSCDEWLKFKKLAYNDYWQNKIAKCLVKAGLSTLAIKSFTGTLLKLSPKVILGEYGITFFNCMW